jgi:hypothetical protein
MTDPFSQADPFLAALNVPYSFEARPEPLPGSLRPQRRVPLLLLLIDKARGGTASWKALHVLSWALRHPSHRELLLALRQNDDELPDRALVRLEPALDRAIDLAVGLGYLETNQRRTFTLTERGRAVVETVRSSDALAEERAFLDQIGGKVTQREVDRLLEWRSR